MTKVSCPSSNWKNHRTHWRQEKKRSGALARFQVGLG